MALSNKQKSYILKKKDSKTADQLARELKIDAKDVRDFLETEKAKEKETNKAQVQPGKKRLFYAVMFAIPILFFVLLEIGLRIGDYRGNLDLFIKPKVFDGEYMLPNPDFTARYFFRVGSTPSPAQDAFLTKKPENGYRIFVLGGSTANGYPYGFNATFSRVVRDALRDVAPDRHVEVINVATSAINSYTLYDQVDEILDFEPDAIMIYAGHNEYYGALGIASTETFGAFPGFVRTYLKLQRYKTFLLLRDGINRVSGWIGRMIYGPQPAVTGTLMQRMVGRQQVPLDSDVYEMGKHQFRSNLNAILRKFDKKDIPVFLGSLSSNLKDQPPFISVETEDHPPADRVFAEAGRAWDQGDYDRALERFTYSKDLDALRFRAPGSFNDLIREVSDERQNVHYVPVDERFAQHSENGIVGFNLMLEHLHPNYEGYFLMGKAFFETMHMQGFPGLNADVARLRDWDDYFAGMHLTELDKRVGDHRIKLLMNGWPFVDEADPDGYPRNYVPVSSADSLAFKVVNEGLRWDRAKVQLAGLYEDQGRHDDALAEYDGLMRDQFYNDSPFIFAARIHLGRNDFASARPLLEHAYTLEKSAFTTKMLGAIEVDAGNYERGIELLEHSRGIEPHDPQTLFNLSGAYAMKQEFQKADEVLRDLERVNPNFPGARQWRSQLDAHLRGR